LLLQETENIAQSKHQTFISTKTNHEVQCDPQSCPQNKLYSRSSSQRKVHDTARAPQSSLLGQETPSVDSFNADFEFSTMNNPTWFTTQDNSSLLDLSRSITTSSSGSWADSPFSNDVSNHCDPSDAIVGSAILSTNVAVQQTHPSKTRKSDTLVSEQRSMAVTDQTSGLVWPGFEPNQPGMEYGEDPFMGWADKRASQTIEEYDWVLSHVEQL
jgi:hypothetical protein